MEATHDSLDKVQKAYLRALRHGIIEEKESRIRNKLSDKSQQDFANFKRFLNDHGHSNPQPRDLYLTAKRQEVLSLLQYVKVNDCLGLQYCFGFNEHIDKGGRMQFINGAGMWQKSILTSDEEVFRSNFEREDGEGDKSSERFLNFIPSYLPEKKAQEYTKNFQDIYTTLKLSLDDFLLGSLLPVKRLKKIFTDPGHPFGMTDTLTFRWGLTDYSANRELGNFTLVIGIGDVTTGPVIEFRTDKSITANVDSAGDCPPRPPCYENK